MSGHNLLADIGAWSKKQFPDATLEGTLAHIEKELHEIREHPDDLYEVADVIILCCQLAAIAGKHDMLMYHIGVKHELNKQRRWPKEPDASGVYQHLV